MQLPGDNNPKEMHTMDRNHLLTFAEVAERLCVDVNIIRRNVRADQLPVVRVGQKVRMPAAWVDDPGLAECWRD